MSILDDSANSIETASDLGKTEESLARRWKLELRLARKRDTDWLNSTKQVYEMYTNHNPKANSFNIFWSNTETLRQACYNSVPDPQCRRRYCDEDPLGLQGAEVLNRSLAFTMDAYDFNEVVQKNVLTMLLPGRAVSRVQYIPEIQDLSESDTPEDARYEQIAWESAQCKEISYQDFRILGNAKCWADVPAIGIRHHLTRQDCIDKFGEDIGSRIGLDTPADENIKQSKEADLFKTAEVWEIWDKENRRVIWITESLPIPAQIQPDPLGLADFFPVPRPLYAIEKENTLEPSTLLSQYVQQVHELNTLSRRINKLVEALRLRGIYDASLTELDGLMALQDNQMMPSQNVLPMLERGGLDKAIWMMPIDTAAMVLKELYMERDATKQIIYEITGISDIMRAASDPNETFGAQKIKTQWGTQRLQKMQSEVQRYVRDLLRLKAEVIAKKFQPETLEKMTMLKLPHQAQVDQQKQMAMMQYQQAAEQAMQSGQQPPPPPQPQPDPITWEAVIASLRDDLRRSYSIDIETDSTLSATQDSDMTNLRNVLSGMSEVIQGFGPAVQAGAIPVEAVKAIMGLVARRAKMGSQVELALDKMQQPPQQKPQSAIDAEKQQQASQYKQQEMQMAQEHEMKMQQIKAQAEQMREASKAQGDQAREQYRAQADNQIAQIRAEMDVATEQAKLEAQFQVEQAKRDNEIAMEQLANEKNHTIELLQQELERWKAQLEASTKITVAQISADSAQNTALIAAESRAANIISTDLE